MEFKEVKKSPVVKEPVEKQMKKLLALVLMLSLVAGLASTTFADAKDKKPAKKVVAKKLLKKKAAKKIVKPVKKAIPAPLVSPAPVPVPAPAAPAPSTGTGMSLGVNAGVDPSLSVIGGELDYSIASIIPDTKVLLGVDYLTGDNDIDTNLKIITAKVGAKYALTMLKSEALPVDWYVGGAFVVPLKVSGGRTGSYGLQAVIGATYTIPGFGGINAQVGYSALKYGGASAAKGVIATVGYVYSF
jgi:hypothetical protein